MSKPTKRRRPKLSAMRLAQKNGLVLFRCSNCGFEAPLREKDFPFGCRCGMVTTEPKGRAIAIGSDAWKQWAPRNHARLLPHGPGTELMALLKELGIDKIPGCDCESLRREMDRLGVEGCRRERERLIKKLEANAAKYSWWDKLKAGAAAVVTGAALHINVTAPLASCFDLAVERAHTKETENANTNEAESITAEFDLD